jgi:predicted AlkP superfamily pyrophosphatase or phosphodiesterase
MVRSGALRRIPRQIFACVGALALLLAPAQGAAPAAPAVADPTVVLISLDGTTPEAGRRGMPTLGVIARRGAWAGRLVPVFPTDTFPNHVTLVTGVHPDRHGIVNNSFRDPVRGVYDRNAGPDWIEVEPLWSLLAARGIPSASFHWVGSEGPWRSGRGPLYWKPFDASVGEREKVAQILAWLDAEPVAARPRLVTAWFHGADHAGHLHGPDAPEVWEALREQDVALAELVAGLDHRGRFSSTTLLVVSDHGMERVRERADLAAALRSAGVQARVFGGGGFATVEIPGGPEAVAKAALAARQLGLEAWPRAEAPPALRLDNPRFGDLVVLAPPGIAIGGGSLRGVHGYRPELASMSALFAAIGRGVPSGLALAEVRSIDVAPTVLALLGVPVPEWMEGRPIAELRAVSGGASEGGR